MHPLSSPGILRRAFTLIELLVVISIVAVLAGISLPVISNVRESGNSTRCIANLRQIGAALDLYANDNNNSFPPITVTGGTDWDSTAINPYLPERTLNGRQSVLFICPSAKYTGYTTSDLSRAYSSTECMLGPTADGSGSFSSWTIPKKRTVLTSLANSLMMFDGVQSPGFRYCSVETTWQALSGSTDLQANNATSSYIDYRHRKSFNGLFGDGHVDTITRSQAPTLVTKTMWTGRTQ